MKKTITSILLICFFAIIAQCCYFLHTLSQRLETNNVYLNELIKYHISNDTLTIDTTKIKYINTDNNEENKGTKERKRNQ